MPNWNALDEAVWMVTGPHWPTGPGPNCSCPACVAETRRRQEWDFDEGDGE